MKTIVINSAVFGGLGLLGIGLWLESPSYALIVVGGILFLSGVWSASR